MEDDTSHDWIFLLALIAIFAIIFFGYLYDSRPEKPHQPIYTPPATETPTVTSTPPPSPTSPPTSTKTAVVSPPTKSPATSTPEPKPTFTTEPTLTPTNSPDFAIMSEIQPGDNLWDISYHWYGTGTGWPGIYEMTNARAGEGCVKRIDDPNLIFPDNCVMVPVQE